MAKRKSFGTYVPGGVPSLEMEINGEVFRVRGSMSGVRLLNMIKALDGDNDVDSAETMVDFIRNSVLIEDRERCMEFLENEDNPVALATLTEIIRWLIEEYTAKPTVPSQPSADGSSSTGSTNTESVSSVESTSSVSTDVPSLPSLPQ